MFIEYTNKQSTNDNKYFIQLNTINIENIITYDIFEPK